MKTINSELYAKFISFIKYFPIFVHFIIAMNIVDYYFQLSLTNWMYPIIGHSVVFDLLLLFVSRMLKFCLWHRILIYNMIFSVSVEWITVNINVSNCINNIMAVSTLISVLMVMLSLVLVFKSGIFEK